MLINSKTCYTANTYAIASERCISHYSDGIACVFDVHQFLELVNIKKTYSLLFWCCQRVIRKIGNFKTSYIFGTYFDFEESYLHLEVFFNQTICSLHLNYLCLETMCIIFCYLKLTRSSITRTVKIVCTYAQIAHF